jgi:hypothetical protein
MPKKRILNQDDYFRALEIYKSRHTIASVQQELNVSYRKAKKLIELGLPDSKLPPFSIAIEERLTRPEKKKRADTIDRDRSLRVNTAIFKGVQKNTLTKLKDGGLIPMKELQQMLEVEDELVKRQKKTHNDLLLPFDDMTDAEFNAFALGKKKPQR